MFYAQWHCSDTLIFISLDGECLNTHGRPFSLNYTDASLLFYFLSLIQCTPSPTRGQATHQFLFLSSVFSYRAEIFTTSEPVFGRGGASGFGGGGASGLARELFEGGVGILMIAVVTSPLLLQFRLPDSSDIRLRLERLRQRERDRGFRTLITPSLVDYSTKTFILL